MSSKLWPMKKISWLFDVIGSGTTPPASNEMYYNSPDIAWLNTGDLKDSYIEKTSKYVSQQALDEFSALTVFPKDSLVMAMYGATIGKLGITKYETTTNQACCVLSKPREVITKFIFYWLMGHRAEIINLSQGGGQPNISQGIIRDIRIAVPPVELQNKIVTFIDKKFEETNQLIDKKEKMINLLEQQRQSIITEAVTRGFNPNVKMKDSGIEWIGEIPEHWDIKRIKHVASINGRIGFRGYTVNDIVSEGEGAITLSPSNIQNGKLNLEKLTYLSWEKYYESPEIMITENDVIFCKTGSSYGKAALVGKVDYPMTLNPQLIVIKVNKISSAYLSYIFQTPLIKNQVETIVAGGTMPTISQESLLSMKFVEPPMKEQEEIVEYLNECDSEYDKILDSISKQIQRLKEYRQALIYEAVTGKIDVRDMELD